METKKNILDDIALRSENVQEVLSQPPHWMLRWGNIIILCIILMILLMSYFIKYPEFLPATIVITSQNPPEKLQARVDSKIEKIFIKDQQNVERGDALMVLQSTANYNDVFELKKLIDSTSSNKLSTFPIEKIALFKLGELQSDYNNFAKAFQDERLFKRLQPYAPENMATNQNIEAYKSRIINLKQQQNIEVEKYELVKKNYKRAQQLFGSKVISAVEFETEKMKYLQALQSLENINISLSQTQEGIANLKKTKSGTSISAEKDRINYASQTNQLFEQLRKSLREWEQNYLIISSINGMVSFQQFWGENQFVKRGDAILSILPNDKKALIGKMTISATNSGKISKGEKVLIKLNNFRYQEYGIIEGRVQNISFNPDEKGNYYVEVILPKGLKTSYNKKLKFDKELSGSAEIVTEELRLIERIFFQTKKLLKYQS
ncbi:HlyD family efflux transporter periplasmic adaptor subunit [Pedobacter changchengzhani]|uniref:HlyD family efflux transporter periplasmic adaptor subunit n=1 Tax=Pedobacter changchengzhani TaxID=2529274 RepID=A0A4R5MKD2_9SPHI|nr:HlyD family efflux transporter periplasmic adaptor subunit [Pedobacter changchengzhani]TDG35655.1 HlyD family efflux transporter periplasmic adaptor subunit [Pedobacter changchengzhani]